MTTKAHSGLRDIKRLWGYRISRLLSYPLIPPEQLYFSLTGRCNLKCGMCNITQKNDSSDFEFSTGECKKIISEAERLGIDHLVFSGGEPLLRKDLFELIGYAISKRIRVVDMITNGQLVDEGTGERLVRSGLNHITFSLDGLEEAHDAVRGGGAFKKTMASIDFINKYKNGNLRPTTAINFTIMGRNIEDILPILDLAKAKKITYMLFQPVLYDNKKMWERLVNDNLWVKESAVVRLREIIAELLKRKISSEPVFINVDAEILKSIPDYFLGQRPGNRLKCYEGIVRMVVGYDGNLWSCPGVYGDVRKRSLVDCWFSKEAANIRKRAKGCIRHCLQPCVYLPGPSGIYQS